MTDTGVCEGESSGLMNTAYVDEKPSPARRIYVLSFALLIATFFATLISVILGIPSAQAHEVRPAYLEIKGTQQSEYSIEWKQPIIEGSRLKLRPKFGPDCQNLAEVEQRILGKAVVESWQIRCDKALHSVSVEGLDKTLTDVILRIEADGTAITTLLRPSQIRFEIGGSGGSGGSGAGSSGLGALSWSYLRLGVEHILLGPDHLLFVLGLVLLLSGRRIFWAVTAFTAAHSITLALAVLGHVSLPARPVEILIAASIVLIALEVVRKINGHSSWIVRHPWPVIFGIGLIHGLGFAGALSDIGLPRGEEIRSLLIFNIGIELGQLAFILVILAIFYFLSKFTKNLVPKVQLATAYLIGISGAFWTLDRIVL